MKKLYRWVYSRKAKQDASVRCMSCGLSKETKVDSCTRQANRYDRQNDTRIIREAARRRMQKGARGQDQGSVQGEGGGVGNKERTKHANKERKLGVISAMH